MKPSVPSSGNLIDEHAPVRQVGSGFEFTEGPIWNPKEQCLLFSDIPASIRRRWDASGVREVLKPANMGNGMTYDRELDLLVCEHATSTVARFDRDGRRTVLASHFEGKELNSPNDIVVKSDGAIYFTDPWYGRMPYYGVERPRQLGWQGVFRTPPGGPEPSRNSSSTALSSPSRTACASRPTRRSSTSMTPSRQTSGSSM